MTHTPPPGPRWPDRAELEALREGPHRFLGELSRRYGHAVRYPVGPIRFFQFTHPDAVQHVLVASQRNYDKQTFQYRLLQEITGPGLLTMDGPAWRTRRRLAQPGFHRARVADFVPVFVQVAERLADRWDRAARAGEPVDVAGDMMHTALQAVVRTLFGVEIGDRADALWRATLDVLHDLMWRARTFALVPRWLPSARNRRYRRSLAVLDDAIAGTIRERRRGVSRPDLLQRLMDARDEETGASLSDAELRNEMMTLLIAGHETVASALTWTWYLLGTHPAEDSAVCTEAETRLGGRAPTAEDLPDLRLTTAVFQEALRLYPPAWVITRRAIEPDTVGGFAVPAGALVVLSPYVTQRHPEFWTEPDAFRPGRFLEDGPPGGHRLAYFPFGGGPHLCIGNHFSLVEATVILGTLVPRFRLEPAWDGAVAVDPGVTLQPRGGLLMRPVLRSSAGRGTGPGTAPRA